MKTLIHEAFGKRWVMLENDRAFESMDTRQGKEWEGPQMRAFLDACQPEGGIIIDCGAGIGTNALRFADAVGPSGEVYAIELQQPVFYALCANILLNGYENVRAVHAAVHEFSVGYAMSVGVDYREDVYDTGGVRSAVNLRPQLCPGPRFIQLDSIAFAKRVCGIKLDIEGDEFFALKGAEWLINLSRPVIFCELSAHYLSTHGQTIQQVKDFMAKRRYRCEPLSCGENCEEVLFLP